MKRRNIIVIIVVVLAIAGYFAVSQIQKAQKAMAGNFQTTTIERGQLVALVGATGTVRSNQSAIIAWQTSGQIDSINVAIDEEVTANQVLAELKRSSLSQNVILAEADLVNAKQALEDLQESEVAQAQAQLALSQAQEAYDKAVERRQSKDYRRSSDATLEEARANYLMAEADVDKYETLYDQVDDRPEDDLTRLSAYAAYANAQRRRDQALANLRYLEGKPDDQEIAIADGNVAVTEAQLADAQRNWDKLKDGPNPDQLKAAQARIDAIEATIRMAKLVAPFNGTITEVRSIIGDQVNPGTLSFRIDDLSRLLVDVQIPEVDINQVKVGQEANITFDAILGKEYTGEVIEVGRVGNVIQGAVNFTVTIELKDADESVLPGMTAAVNIIVNQLDDVLIVPNRAVRLVNGDRVVYTLGANNLPEQIKIQIGSTSDMFSEVIGGDIKEGTTIILNPPTEFMGGGGGPFGGMR